MPTSCNAKRAHVTYAWVSAAVLVGALSAGCGVDMEEQEPPMAGEQRRKGVRGFVGAMRRYESFDTFPVADPATDNLL